MSDLQRRMQDVLDTAVRDGRELGVQLAVYLDGELVVDVCAGTTDRDGTPVARDTLFPVFSVTKGIAATMMHILVERGLIDYNMPVAKVWPEFAAHGKGDITLRHILSHTSGLPYMPLGIGYKEVNDWNLMCKLITDMKPSWPAGEQQMYHAVTNGWLVGEVIQRVSGKSFADMLKEDITDPLGVSNELFVGIPDSMQHRVALLDEIFESGKAPQVDDSVPQSIPGWLQPLHTMMNRPDTRRACIPASNGIMTARALAKHYAALLPGGVDGVELLPPQRVRQATQLVLPKIPAAAPLNRGLGYAVFESLDNKDAPSFGHGGYGGANGFAEPNHRMAVGLTKNLYSPIAAHGDIIKQLRIALGFPV